jgi:hypothetical protein
MSVIARLVRATHDLCDGHVERGGARGLSARLVIMGGPDKPGHDD